MKEKKYKCIYCSSTNVKSNGGKQLYCKDCKKYFKEGSRRKKYSKPIELVIKSVQRLIFPGAIGSKDKIFSIKDFYKLVKSGEILNFHQPCIKYIKPKLSDSKKKIQTVIDVASEQIAIIARTDSGFTVVRGLEKGDNIKLKDISIKIS